VAGGNQEARAGDQVLKRAGLQAFCLRTIFSGIMR